MRVLTRLGILLFCLVILASYLTGCTYELVAPDLKSPNDGAIFSQNAAINFSWDGVKGAASYEIQYGEAAPVSTGNKTASQWAGGTVGYHTWKVRALNGKIMGPWSPTRSFSITQSNTASTMAIGDSVKAKADVEVRSNPGVNQTLVKTMQGGSTGTLASGPANVD